LKPTIAFHSIKSLRLTDVRELESDGGKFWTRDLVIEDAEGEHYTLPLFSYESAESLHLNPHG